ncbi:MAG: PAS domain S-box protein [Thermodesulfobacteria bacterium]|nr:PAS domain S-box protein [Thermodesulfobacteriota bacterium]
MSSPSNRKKIDLEQALIESEAKFRTLTESAAVGIFLYREKFLYANPAMEAITGYSLKELYDIYLWDIVHPEHREMVRERILRRLAGEKPPPHYEIKIITKQGQVRWLEVTAATFEQEGKIVGVGTAIDITDKKEFARNLEETIVRYQTIFNAFQGFIYAISEDYRLELLNARLLQYLGREVQGQLCFRTLFERESPCPWCRVKKVFEGEGAQWEFQDPRNGRWYRVVASPLRYPSAETQALLLVEDVTDRKKAEEELLRASKFESLAMLAGGIAHDFNNFLTAILGSLTLVRLKSKLPKDIEHLINQAEQACLKARGLTQQLLTFAKGGAPVKKTASLRDILRETVSFCLRGSNVNWYVDIAPDLALVDIDVTQMSQVISNLVINAKQAMPHGGRLLVRAENVDLNGEFGLPPGRYVRISVTDEGEGIDPEILPKIFDPYFTTKEDGTGLGLAISYSIIRSHGGHIGVSSRKGVGTTFEIYLPASEGQREEMITVSETLPRGTARVLVLEDEELVRQTFREALEFAGYEVEEARNADEAIEKVKMALATSSPFEVAILDLTIPGSLGGLEVLPLLKEADPELKTILASGYANQAPEEYRGHGFDAVLKKPFTIEELLTTMKRVLST